MAELTQKERLQPSLLDRLADNEPESQQESRDKRVLSPARLRESVRRDLAWLFNTINLASVMDLSEAPLVAGSVLNYGLPDLAGHTAASVDIRVLQNLLRRAIWDFEPRLVRNSVQVRLVVNRDQLNHNAMFFDIEAELWAQPLPLRLFLRTEIDLEDGSVEIVDLGGQGSG
jgi:type VI secretion system protein ImpF